MEQSAAPQRQRVVYVVQEDPSKNMTSALDFGSVECLLEHREEATLLNVSSIVAKIKYGLRNYRKGDYLLLSGSPISCGIACAVASDETGGTFTLLKWDGQERRYWAAEVNLKQGE